MWLCAVSGVKFIAISAISWNSYFYTIWNTGGNLDTGPTLPLTLSSLPAGT